jgi:uncharacterized protein YbjQ (UPF0145 family)
MTEQEDRLSQAAVQQGGLPLRAQRRMAELGAAPNGFFTSTLTPAEGVIAKAAGLTVVSQVMGTSTYHVGFTGYVNTWSGGELGPLTLAHERARLLALSRMEQEAMLLRAHAVIDTRFIARSHAWAEDLIEYTAIGTAVRFTSDPPPPRPALTLLRADQYAKLHKAGYTPLGIAMGNCFWFDPHADCSRDGAYWSCELPAHTVASQQVRDLAVARFRASAQRFQDASGVLGVTVHRHVYSHEHDGHCRLHADLMVMGTAVARKPGTHEPPRPLLVVDLRDRGTTRGYQP